VEGRAVAPSEKPEARVAVNDTRPLTKQVVFERTKEQLYALQESLGVGRRVGPSGAAALLKAIRKHPGAPVIEAVLAVEGGDLLRAFFRARRKGTAAPDAR
ncbi:MAG: hypothetical protein KKE42_08355, partial [Alphaproteobacteria bacterium]|nr:hypothetical protein [Alphaproteobacteria bacterium]